MRCRKVEPEGFTGSGHGRKPAAFENAPADLAIIGRYIFTPDIFDAIERTLASSGGEFQITDAIRLLLRMSIYAVKRRARDMMQEIA